MLLLLLVSGAYKPSYINTPTIPLASTSPSSLSLTLFSPNQSPIFHYKNTHKAHHSKSYLKMKLLGALLACITLATGLTLGPRDGVQTPPKFCPPACTSAFNRCRLLPSECANEVCRTPSFTTGIWTPPCRSCEFCLGHIGGDDATVSDASVEAGGVDQEQVQCAEHCGE